MSVPAVTDLAPRFTKPEQPTVRPWPSVCRQLVDPGYGAQCVPITGGHGQQAYGIIETSTTSKEERALVYTRRGNQAVLALRSINIRGYDYGGRLVEVVDLNKDGDPKLIFATPSQHMSSAPGRIAFDVIETSGVEVLHVPLVNGTGKQLPGGGLEAWSQEPDGRFLHEVFRYDHGVWQREQAETVPASSVPPSNKFSDNL